MLGKSLSGEHLLLQRGQIPFSISTDLMQISQKE